MIEKNRCPICRKIIGIKKEILSNLIYDIKNLEEINNLSLMFLFTGVCPFCEKKVKRPQIYRKKDL